MKLEWAEKIYYGDKATKDGLKSIRKMIPALFDKNYYFIVKPSNEENLLDIFSVLELKKDCYKDKVVHIKGIAVGYDEALETAAHIVNDTYKETGAFR